jgi:hypothetical protein
MGSLRDKLGNAYKAFALKSSITRAASCPGSPPNGNLTPSTDPNSFEHALFQTGQKSLFVDLENAGSPYRRLMKVNEIRNEHEIDPSAQFSGAFYIEESEAAIPITGCNE